MKKYYMKTFYCVIMLGLFALGCSYDKKPKFGELASEIKILPHANVLEVAVTNHSEKDLWLLSGRSRISLSYEVFENGKKIVSANAVDTVPHQMSGGLEEWSYLPSLSLDQNNEQYIVQFAIDENIRQDFNAGDEVKVSVTVSVKDATTKEHVTLTLPYQNIDLSHLPHK